MSTLRVPVCYSVPEAPLEHGCASSAPLERPVVCGRRPHQLRRAARERQRAAHDPMAPERPSGQRPQRAVAPSQLRARGDGASLSRPWRAGTGPSARDYGNRPADRGCTRSACAMRTGCRKSRWPSSSSRCSSRSAAARPAPAGSPAARLLWIRVPPRQNACGLTTSQSRHLITNKNQPR